MPYLSVVDSTPASTRSVSALIEDIRFRTQEAVGRHMRLPVLVLDDLAHLSALTGSRSPSDLLSRLDDALKAESVSGLLAATPADVSRGGADRRLPVTTVLLLTPGAPGALGNPLCGGCAKLTRRPLCAGDPRSGGVGSAQEHGDRMDRIDPAAARPAVWAVRRAGRTCLADRGRARAGPRAL